MHAKKSQITKIALSLSALLLILWAILGTGASIAWFVDTTPVEKNMFNIGDLSLDVSYMNEETGEWTRIDGATDIFDDSALYEPGYVQVVYLKIDNIGDVDFDYQLAVRPDEIATASNVYGSQIILSEHLLYGVVFADTYEQLRDAALKTRENAKKVADTELSLYTSDLRQLDAQTLEDSTEYAAIVVYMPEKTGNEANFRDDKPPSVELGIVVKATQRGTQIS